MDYKITLGQLIITVLLLLGIVIGVYLVLLISKVIKTIEKVNSIIDSNKENIDNTIKAFPEICNNVTEITGSVKRKTDILDGFLGGNDEAAATSSVSGLESVVSSISSILEIITEVKNFFSGSKKRSFKIKR